MFFIKVERKVSLIIIFLSKYRKIKSGLQNIIEYSIMFFIKVERKVSLNIIFSQNIENKDFQHRKIKK
jgi:hypothetical protein